MSQPYQGCRVLVTGGLGFIGSALTVALVSRGARVRVLDSLLPHFGGSPRNLGEVATRVDVVLEDTRNRDAVNRAVRDVDLIFHFAAPAGPGAGPADFYTDLDVACLGTWHLLEAMRVYAPDARVVFASSHHVYTPRCVSPVSEDGALGPDTLFGAHKLAGERYLGVYQAAYGLDVAIARLTAVFGPRQRLQSAGSSGLARALDAALHGEEVSLYDGGDSLADYLYLPDAVEAFLLLGRLPEVRGQVVNVGSGQGVTSRKVAETVIAAVGRGRLRQAVLERGVGETAARGFVADVARLRGLGLPKSSRTFEDAVRETAAWYLGGGA